MDELHLFAGVGGGILGGQLLGHTTRCSVEIEPFCREILLRRQADGLLPIHPVWDDVCTFDGRPLTDALGGDKLTSSQGVSHAQTSPLPNETRTGSQAKGQGCGEKWRELSKKSIPSLSSSRIAPSSEPEDSMSSSMTLPTWGMMLDGVLWGRTKSASIISEKDSGLLPTPITTDYKGGTVSRRKDNGKLRLDQWRDYVKIKFGLVYPHPTHSELRMGFPQEWTAPEPLGMPSVREWLRLHGRFLPVDGYDFVVYADECQPCECCDDLVCTQCADHYADCNCLGPTQDGVDFAVFGDLLIGKKLIDQ